MWKGSIYCYIQQALEPFHIYPLKQLCYDMNKFGNYHLDFTEKSLPFKGQ